MLNKTRKTTPNQIEKEKKNYEANKKKTEQLKIEIEYLTKEIYNYNRI